MVEFRVFNVTKKIDIVYRLRKKPLPIPKLSISRSRLRVNPGKDIPGCSRRNDRSGCRPDSRFIERLVHRPELALRRVQLESQVVMGSPEIPLMQFGAINIGRYKAGAVPQSTNMYSWPMNNYWVTNFQCRPDG